jgi:hypothetical protein
VHDATPAALKAAQKSFESANAAYDARRFDEALKTFRASYDIVASPNSRLMIARSLRELGRVDEAYQEFEASLADARAAATKDAKKYGKTVAAAEAEIVNLRQRVALVKVEIAEAPPGTTVHVGDRTIDAGSLARPLVLPPGAAVISARAPSGESAEQKLELAAGTEQTVRLTLSNATAPAVEAPPSPTEPSARQQAHTSVDTASGGAPLRTLGIVVGGIGVVGLAGFAIFGSLNNSKFDELESECTPDGTCPPERQDDIDSGRTYQTLANVGLIVGAVGVAVGTTLFVVGGSSERASSGTLQVGLGPGRVAVRGSF